MDTRRDASAGKATQSLVEVWDGSRCDISPLVAEAIGSLSRVTPLWVLEECQLALELRWYHDDLVLTGRDLFCCRQD
jgi:hypothetical protein